MWWVSNTVHVRTLSMMNLIMYNQLNNKPQLYILLLLKVKHVRMSARTGWKLFTYVPDCLVLGCRLVLIMEDLLWVLTDDQLKAALHFADSLTGLLKRATEETQKIKGARKLEVVQFSLLRLLYVTFSSIFLLYRVSPRSKGTPRIKLIATKRPTLVLM